MSLILCFFWFIIFDIIKIGIEFFVEVSEVFDRELEFEQVELCEVCMY